MNKTWPLVLIFIGIFVTGVVSGGFLAFRYSRSVAVKKIAEQFSIQELRKIGDQLQLTREQRERMKPIWLRAGAQLRDINKERSAVLEQMIDDVKKELNEAQRAKYDEIREKMENENRERGRRWQRWLKEQRNVPPPAVDAAPASKP